MTAAIPDDILYTAGTVVADITENPCMTLMGDVEKMAEPIAIALHAERNRCALIASRFEEEAAKVAEADLDAFRKHASAVAEFVANQIAVRIRSPRQPTGE